MEKRRSQTTIATAVTLLLLASILACQLGRAQPTAGVIVVTPTPAPAVPTQPPQVPTQPSPPTPSSPSALAGGVTIDDFEGTDFEARWWSDVGEGVASFACAPDQPGQDSAQAMRLTFEVGADSYAGCGTGVDLGRWANARGVSFSWRADQPGLTVDVAVSVENPTQTDQDAGGVTPFGAQLTPSEAWTPVTLAWDDLAKAEWMGEGGADTLDPAYIVALSFYVGGEQRGSIWVDNLQLLTDTPMIEAPGVPVIQYFTSEPVVERPGCYHLHWDASDATTVYLDDDAVDNPGSTAACPEEAAAYTLRAENAVGSVEQALTVEPNAGVQPVPSLAPEQVVAPSEAEFRCVIFLHHSCGANLIAQGDVRPRLTSLGYEFYDHGYNEDGLVLADGTWTGRNFDVPDDNTDPDGFAAIFAQPLHDPPDNTFSHLMQYDVIAFKSCFPVSLIESDEQLAAYKSYYLSIRDRMDQYPNNIFIVVTQPPAIPNDTDSQAAARARAFTNWLASDEYLSGHTNVFTFNFFDLLADPSDNMLRAEYRIDEWDGHPNELANQTIGPLFVEFIDRVISTYSDR